MKVNDCTEDEKKRNYNGKEEEEEGGGGGERRVNYKGRDKSTKLTMHQRTSTHKRNRGCRGLE
jgi:hypothetical protein